MPLAATTTTSLALAVARRWVVKTTITMVMAVTMQEERDGGGNCISAGVSGGDAIAPSGPKSMCFLCGKFSSAARINAFINGMPSNMKINKKQCHFI